MLQTKAMVNYIGAANVNFDFDFNFNLDGTISIEERENKIMEYNAKLQLFMELAIEEFVRNEFPNVTLFDGVSVEIECIDEDLEK
ncbi:hypothetical protein ABFJ98_3833 [Acinetobacter baumannii]